jgi:hypothetical protein
VVVAEEVAVGGGGALEVAHRQGNQEGHHEASRQHNMAAPRVTRKSHPRAGITTATATADINGIGGCVGVDACPYLCGAWQGCAVDRERERREVDAT